MGAPGIIQPLGGSNLAIWAAISNTGDRCYAELERALCRNEAASRSTWRCAGTLLREDAEFVGGVRLSRPDETWATVHGGCKALRPGRAGERLVGSEAGTYIRVWKVQGHPLYDGLESFALQKGEETLKEWGAKKGLQVKEWHDPVCALETLGRMTVCIRGDWGQEADKAARTLFKNCRWELNRSRWKEKAGWMWDPGRKWTLT